MEHEIVRSVAAAQKDAQAADALVRQYLPFIKAETAKFLKRIPVEGQDDELGIAMFAFHEAAMAYQSGRGSFLKLAAAAIRNRLIDYQRMEQRHAGHISLDQTVDGDAEGRTLLETIDTGHDEIAHRQELGAAQEEIMQFARELAQYGLRLTDIAENCPKKERTLAACHRVLSCAREYPAYLAGVEAVPMVPSMSGMVDAYYPQEPIDIDNYAVAVHSVGGRGIFAREGVRYVVARSGDSYADIAQALGIPERRLKRFNRKHLPAGRPAAGDEVYIDRPRKS